jgi:hypothetical protein
MKVLLIAEREDLKQFLDQELILRGAEIVHYWHPIKAMDNLEETAPELVIFSAQDFPRHWKIFLVYLREYSQGVDIPFILLSGDSFAEDELEKARTLKVTAIFPESFKNADDLLKLKDYIIPENSMTASGAANQAYHPADTEKADILFTHPEKLVLIQGRILEISALEISFRPLTPELCEDINPLSVLRSCSLSILDTIIAADMEIIENIGIIKARFVSGREEIAAILRL